VEEHLPSKQVVTGSNPVESINEIAQLVEQEFHELLVIGSNPIFIIIMNIWQSGQMRWS
jgi:hypothetical protein